MNGKKYKYELNEIDGDKIRPNYYKMSFEGREYDVFDLMEIMIGDNKDEYSIKEIITIFNIIKYITRYKNKNGLEDIKKVITYAEFLAKEVNNLETINEEGAFRIIAAFEKAENEKIMKESEENYEV